MTDALRFCPFCREPFEGLEECPDHGVRLISWAELDRRERERLPDLDARLSPLDLRFGRGLVLAGAVLVLLGLGLPWVAFGPEPEDSIRGFALWQLHDDYLFVVPAAAALGVATAFLRRTRRQLMAARYAIVGAQLVAAIAVGYALREALAASGVRIGAVIAAVGLLISGVGALRFGRGRV